MSNEQQLEAQLQAKGLTAPRITPEDVTAAIASHTFGFSPSGKSYLCDITLHNGFVVRGEAAVASPENFNLLTGQQLTYGRAREAIWPYLGFLLHQRQWEAAQAAKGADPAPAVSPEDALLQRLDALGVALFRLLKDAAATINAQQAAARDANTPEAAMVLTRITFAEPGRWLSMARTDLQTGVSNLRRAVQQPTEF
jgi:hypothetical protein